MTKSGTIVAAALLCAAATIAGTVILVARGSAGEAPPPGVSAGVSALDRLPTQASLPAPVVRFIEVASRARATDPEAAKLRVRKLRSALGKTRSDLYAFENASGAPCFILVGQVGLCPKSASDGSPGLQWTVGGGYRDVPSNLVGIASDDVTKVELTVDGADVPVSLENNVAFAEYARTAERARISIHRQDGSESSVDVRLDSGPSNADLEQLRTERALKLKESR
jgi:hypothetical protein